jgi:hypothetical protein
MSLPERRHVIQIAATEGGVTALCSDGSVWVYHFKLQSWMRIDTTDVEQAESLP